MKTININTTPDDICDSGQTPQQRWSMVVRREITDNTCGCPQGILTFRWGLESPRLDWAFSVNWTPVPTTIIPHTSRLYKNKSEEGQLTIASLILNSLVNHASGVQCCSNMFLLHCFSDMCVVKSCDFRQTHFLEWHFLLLDWLQNMSLQNSGMWVHVRM